MMAIALSMTSSTRDEVAGVDTAPEPVPALAEVSVDEVGAVGVAVPAAGATGGATLSKDGGGAIGAPIADATLSESKSN
jgi:hypothetical protein